MDGKFPTKKIFELAGGSFRRRKLSFDTTALQPFTIDLKVIDAFGRRIVTDSSVVTITAGGIELNLSFLEKLKGKFSIEVWMTRNKLVDKILKLELLIADDEGDYETPDEVVAISFGNSEIEVNFTKEIVEDEEIQNEEDENNSEEDNEENYQEELLEE